MSRTIVKTLTVVLRAGALASCLAAIPAQAQVQVTIYPPAWFIATSSPVYYEGHASYWYGNQWYYRDGRSWRHYDHEPSRLREARAHGHPNHKMYGRQHGGGFKRR